MVILGSFWVGFLWRSSEGSRFRRPFFLGDYAEIDVDFREGFLYGFGNVFCRLFDYSIDLLQFVPQDECAAVFVDAEFQQGFNKVGCAALMRGELDAETFKHFEVFLCLP